MQVPVQVTRQKRGRGDLEYKWIVAIVVIFGAFMSILDQTIVNIAIPHLQNAFGADLNAVQWVLTAYILTQGVVTPTTAFFADRLGTKRFYLIALAIFTCGSALCGLAWSLPILVVFRIFQGIGGAFLFPLSITLLYHEFPLEQRGLASGLFGVAALLAPAVGPTLGGYFVTYANWPLIFYVNVPIGVVGFLLASLLLREIEREAQARFDLPGFLLAAGGLASLLYALSDASVDGWTSTKVLAFLIAGLVLLIGFVAVELSIANRGGQPLVNLKLFASEPFLTSNIANVLITFAFFGGLFLFPVYLQNLRGLSAFQAGLLLLPQAFASIITALIGGRLVDRFGVRIVVIPGLLLLVFVTWQFTMISLSTPYQWLQALFVLRGFALGVIIQPLSVSALAEIRPRQFAQASSLYTVLRFVSTSLGIAVLATLVQTQAQVHYSHLAEQVIPVSSLARLITGLQAFYRSHGAAPASVSRAVIQTVIQLVQRQGYVLAINDAFRVTLAVTLVAVLATLLVRVRRHPLPIRSGEHASAEIPGVEEESTHIETIPGV